MGQSRRSVIAVALVVGVIAAALALLLTGGGQAEADTVRFQNAGQTGPDPFTPPADVQSEEGDESPSDGQDGSGSSTPDGEDGTETPSGGQDGDSTQPGTFGGTGEDRVCDREKLIEELSADPDKLREWAEVVGVEPNEETVESYIRELRPVTLTQDAQVTNHSYTGGSANPYQAIMQKGTAVLVDKDGKPVTRCRCGNPLAEPVELEEETKCIDCPPNYQPPPPCEHYNYPDDKYKQYDDQDFESQVKPGEYQGKCYKPDPEPPPVKEDGEPPDEEPTPEECREDPTAPGCEQQCADDPTLPHCDETPSEEVCADDPTLPQCDDTPTPDGEEPTQDGEEPPPDGQETPPDSGGTSPDGGTPPDGEQP